MYWSLTSLRTYEQCGLKYKFRYVDRVKEQRSYAAERGLDKHAAVEKFVRGDEKTLPDDLSFYSSFLQGLRNYENYPEHKVALTTDWTPVSWSDATAWFKGVLDLKLIKNPQEACVYDWKTGKIYPDHDDQKSIYSLATFSEHPALYTVRAIHVYLDSGSNREKIFHRDQVQQLREQWKSRVQELMEHPQYIPNPGWGCRYCSYSRAKGGPCQF